MLGGAASLGLLVAARHAVGQRPVKQFRIGYLSLRAGPNAWDEAFVQRLRELGYRNGDNLLIEYRWAEEDLIYWRRGSESNQRSGHREKRAASSMVAAFTLCVTLADIKCLPDAR